MLASETVRALLSAKIASIGYSPKEFRDEDDAITESELPAVLIQQAGVIEIDRYEGTLGGAVYHSAPYFLSFAAITRDAAAAMLANTVAALADDYNLGGQVQEILPVSYGDEENDGKDLTAIMLEIRVRFCTAPNDFSTLLT
jgi:hypothetical protein